MKGTPPFSNQRLTPDQSYQWLAGLGQTLRRAERKRFPRSAFSGAELRFAANGCWMLLAVSRKIKIAVLVAYEPAGRLKLKTVFSRTGAKLSGRGSFGRYAIQISLPDAGFPFFRIVTRVSFERALSVQCFPRDLCVLSNSLDPFEGEGQLFTCQTENAAAQTFFGIPDEGVVFYFQNLSSLSEYFRVTKAKIRNVVSGRWPSSGFALPGGEEPIANDREITISDLYIRPGPDLGGTNAPAAKFFLESLGLLYPALDPPGTEFTDWPSIAEASLGTFIKSKECCPRVKGQRYFQAYIGSCAKPPESMVQAALIVPITEYEQWRRKTVPLLKELQGVPAGFFEAKVKNLVRWLPGREFRKEERSEEEHRYRMDSWYLLHTLLNYSRLAQMGHLEAGKILLKSIDSVIETARLFRYEWPVFFDQRDHTVFKEETEPGKGGEQDAAGLFVKLMTEVYLLTHDKRFLAEAELSAEKLTGLSFGILYQTNNTTMAAVGLARLWKMTGNAAYRDLSIECIGSVMSHLWLWEIKPGTLTFMALPPLHDAPYVALYEEAEILAALIEWQRLMAEELPAGGALLIAEYQRHLLSRAKFYYPSELPSEMLPDGAKEGPLVKNLRIPLEGLGPPSEKAGTVGQAVYAAAAPFILCTRGWQRLPNVPFWLFSEYPVLECHADGNAKKGELKARLGGSPALRSRIIVQKLPSKNPPVLRCLADRKPVSFHPGQQGPSALIAGGSAIEIHWNASQA